MVNEDIALHYGRLPPSFLPLGNQRLFSLQAEQANGGPVAMTVPDDFTISEIDLELIEKAGIQLLPQPQSLSLTEAICAAVESLDFNGPLRILYGDTLVRSHANALEPDQMVVQKTTSNYPWAFVVEDDDGSFHLSNEAPKALAARQVVCGDYCFSDPQLLVKACRSGNIIEALNAYHQKKPLELVDAEDWFDFGHLPLYFQSKKSIMIKRVFNRLAYENHQLVKQSDDTDKMRAEANWYENIPSALALHTPRYGGRVERDFRAGYSIEYLYHPLLADLAGFGSLPLSSWLEILSACFEFAEKCQSIRPATGSPEASEKFATRFFDKMIVSKTWDRLESYLSSVGRSLDDTFTLNGQTYPALREVVQNVIDAIPPTTTDHIRFWHGDMFFGNMFYDFTARRILAIDPRGQLGSGQQSLFGDWRYDLAKLAHSVIGQYDKIILGRSNLVAHDDLTWDMAFSEQPHQSHMEQIFMEQASTKYGLNPSEITAMTAVLFFSMLPLHSDRPDLQKQMLANGLRLAGQVKGVLA